MNPIKTALLIEDNPGDARLLREMFRDGDAQAVALSHVESMSEAERHLPQHSADIILLDPGLQDTQGLESVRRIRAAAPRIPLIVLTGLDDDNFADRALRDGAQDYLIKNEIEPRGLLRAMRYAYERNRLEQIRDDFVSTVSHELRTPLTSISGSLALLIDNAAGKLPAPAARLLSIAYNNCQRLVRLINDILDVERMESGRVIFAVKRIDVRALVQHSIEANRGFAESYGVRVKLEPHSCACEMAGDPDLMAQVVTNLLSNAIKFSERGQEVIVAIARRASTLRLSVSDHGCGIPKGFRSKVFEKFAQADNTNARQKGGTGLGLSIVKQIVAQLGGDVTFEDAPGGGTVFYVDLPDWDHRPPTQFAPRAKKVIPSKEKKESQATAHGRVIRASHK